MESLSEQELIEEYKKLAENMRKNWRLAPEFF